MKKVVFLMRTLLKKNNLKTTTMKKVLISLSAAILITATLQAQTKMNAVKTDLFSPVVRTGVLKYERVLNDAMSFQLGFFYTGFKPSGSTTEFSGFGITPEFRYYLSDKPAPDGFYLAPNVRYYKFTLKETDTDSEGTLSNVSIALNLGYQVLLKNTVVIDIWLGPSYNFRSLEATVGDFDTGPVGDANGFGVRSGLAIGVVF
jgi:hypothetical protein